jgi:hypothetical protein
VVVIIFIVAAIWYFCRRKRSNEAGQHVIHKEMVELPNAQGGDLFTIPTELMSQQSISELGGGKRDAGRPSELWDPHAISELGE